MDAVPVPVYVMRQLLSRATKRYPEVRRAYYSATLERLVERDIEVVRDFGYHAMDTLSETCPPYIYFGAHPGDGSDFGYWIDWDAIEEDRYSGDLPSGDECPTGHRGAFLQVNDHGNCTLLIDGKEAWSCV